MNHEEQPASGPEPGPDQPGGADAARDAEPCPDDAPELRAAAEGVEKAKAAMHEAQQYYERIREEAGARLQQARETRVGDLIDGLLGLVRKYPGTSVLTALLAGICLGRRFRR